jgi:hypothetical protein
MGIFYPSILYNIGGATGSRSPHAKGHQLLTMILDAASAGVLGSTWSSSRSFPALVHVFI